MEEHDVSSQRHRHVGDGASSSVDNGRCSVNRARHWRASHKAWRHANDFAITLTLLLSLISSKSEFELEMDASSMCRTISPASRCVGIESDRQRPWYCASHLIQPDAHPIQLVIIDLCEVVLNRGIP